MKKITIFLAVAATAFFILGVACEEENGCRTISGSYTDRDAVGCPYDSDVSALVEGWYDVKVISISVSCTWTEVLGAYGGYETVIRVEWSARVR